jgi:hypothetical protein
MPVFERKSLKSQFFDSLYLRNLAKPLRPELYLLGAGIGLLVWLFRPLEHFFFHWPMFFGIGVVGLIARTIERQKNLAAKPEGTASHPLPVILQLLQDLTSCIFLALPLTLAAAIASPTEDQMLSLVLEVLFPLLNFRFLTSLCCWLVYRLAYGG